MRALVLVLIGLAGLKIWTQDRLYRSATEEALINAYRATAIEACQKQRATKDGKTPLPPVAAWTRPAAIHLAIGRRDVDVSVWDVDNPMWAVKYKYLLLVLEPTASSFQGVCEYDVTLGTATLIKARS